MQKRKVAELKKRMQKKKSCRTEKENAKKEKLQN
jgi:hypothetical protein